jgi:hypothetical protein
LTDEESSLLKHPQTTCFNAAEKTVQEPKQVLKILALSGVIATFISDAAS